MLKMRYKGFTWPNNPKTYTISCERQTAVHKIPMGGFVVQDLGQTSTVLRGEGEFYGAGAYETYRSLLAAFSSGGAGVLVHPVWQCGAAWFTRLHLTQEPREDYVAYSFEFCEGTPMDAQGAGAAASLRSSARNYHVMQQGESAWSVCAAFGLTMQQLLAMNPGIGNPNEMTQGTAVRVQ